MVTLPKMRLTLAGHRQRSAKAAPASGRIQPGWDPLRLPSLRNTMAAMNRYLLLLFLAGALASAQTAPQAPPVVKSAAPMPVIRQNGAVKQMMVDGKPFIMLAGELHNSSASSIEYMKPIWKKLEAMHLNTAIGTASWELVEPQEGKFDFALVDDQIHQARAHNMRLVLIWFATWKNANASYIPLWVKKDYRRFPRVQSKDGVAREELTPLGEESLAADSKAFRTPDAPHPRGGPAAHRDHDAGGERDRQNGRQPRPVSAGRSGVEPAGSLRADELPLREPGEAAARVDEGLGRQRL